MGPASRRFRQHSTAPSSLPRAFHYPVVVGARCRWSVIGQRWRCMGSSSLSLYLSLSLCMCTCVAFFFLPHLFHRTCPSPEHQSTVDVVPVQLDMATRAHINLPRSTVLKCRGVTCFVLAPSTAGSGVPSMLGGFRGWLPMVATEARHQHLVVRDLSCSVHRSLSSLDLAHLGPSPPPPL